MRRGRGREELRAALAEVTAARVAALLVSTWAAMACGGEVDPAAGDAAPGGAYTGTPPGTGATGATTTAPLDGGTGAVGIGTGGENAGGAGPTTPPPPERFTELWGQECWVEFKRLWRDLDAAAIGSADPDPTRAEELATELDTQLACLSESGALRPEELLFLQQLTSARLEVLGQGPAFWMLHRMVFLFEQHAFDSLTALEEKLDQLEQLRSACVLEAGAYREGLARVEEEAISAFALSQLRNDGSSQLDGFASDAEGAELLGVLDEYIATERAAYASDPELAAVLDKMAADLAPVHLALTTIPLLVQELERCP